MQSQQTIERGVIDVGYATDDRGRTRRVCKPGESRVIEGRSTSADKLNHVRAESEASGK